MYFDTSLWTKLFTYNHLDENLGEVQLRGEIEVTDDSFNMYSPYREIGWCIEKNGGEVWDCMRTRYNVIPTEAANFMIEDTYLVYVESEL